MRGGTKPGDFVADAERLLEVRARLWGRWGWRHEDHHLRQFGV